MFQPLMRHANKFRLAGLVLGCAAVTSGCSVLSELTSGACALQSDSAHCYQEAAVQSDDPNRCDLIKQKEEFKKAGSNPPKDKCFLMVAENSDNPTTCKRIQGGLFSYTQEECVTDIATTRKDPTVCSTLSGALSDCVDAATKPLLDEVKADLASKEKLTPEQLMEIQDKLAKSQKMYDMMGTMTKAQYDMQMSAVKNLRI